MKPLRNVAAALKKAKRVKEAVDAKNGPPMLVPRTRWEDLIKDCVNAESEVEHLQGQIEDLNLQLDDVKELYRRQYDESIRLSRELNVAKSSTTGTLAERETRIANLLAELKQTEANRKYACDHIMEQNKLIRDAKATMEALRDENHKLKQERVNAEHLAKKVVQFQKELEDRWGVACSYQRGKDSYSSPCGVCVACKLDESNGIIERTAKNVESVEKERDAAKTELQFTLSVLNQTSENLAKVNRERDAVKDTAHAAVTEARGLSAALQKETTHLKEIIRQQKEALEVISRGCMFKHAGVAHDALLSVAKYKEDNNLL